jgi:hypothetical protein
MASLDDEYERDKYTNIDKPRQDSMAPITSTGTHIQIPKIFKKKQIPNKDDSSNKTRLHKKFKRNKKKEKIKLIKDRPNINFPK